MKPLPDTTVKVHRIPNQTQPTPMKVIIGLPLSLAFLFLLQLPLALAGGGGGGGGNVSTSMVYSSNNAVLPNENAKLSWADDPAPTVVGHENNQSTQRIKETLDPLMVRPKIIGGEPAGKGEFKVRQESVDA